MQTPYISRVRIKNFRNFKDVDVALSHKQVIIGENSVGKTNFLRAIQLILDPTFSEEDRYLTEQDFYEQLENPMENKEEIEIIIEIRGYEHNKNILAEIGDACVLVDPPTLRLTYRYYPETLEDGTINYDYIIFKGKNEENAFTYSHRKYLNIKVINAIRDVENEMKNSKKSPINRLIKQYNMDRYELELLASQLKDQSSGILKLDEISDLTNNINRRFTKIIGIQPGSNISLDTIDINPNRILNTLKVMIGEYNKRPTSETSLGINNILYISLILLSLEDKTIPTLIKSDLYKELLLEEGSEILMDCYKNTINENFRLIEDLELEKKKVLYSFMDQFSKNTKGITFLAIEEPEAHLHPTLQRIIYKDVMLGDTSVLMTTHSPYITSVAPLDSIVHLRTFSNETVIKTTAGLGLLPNEVKDIERYIDVKRGELYFGKGVILVEGIAEEYLVSQFAELMKLPLDQKGIIVCNVNSTNFKPYVKFLYALDIPFVVITDGDYYTVEQDNKGNETKKFHIMSSEEHNNYGYLGFKIIEDVLVEIGKIKIENIPSDNINKYAFFRKLGFFIGEYTLEVDIMEKSAQSIAAKKTICEVFEELTSGGDKKKSNFRNELSKQEYWKCLSKIEENPIGKGRFAQRFSTCCTEEHIPDYVKNSIRSIYEKLDEEHSS